MSMKIATGALQGQQWETPQNRNRYTDHILSDRATRRYLDPTEVAQVVQFLIVRFAVSPSALPRAQKRAGQGHKSLTHEQHWDLLVQDLEKPCHVACNTVWHGETMEGKIQLHWNGAVGFQRCMTMPELQTPPGGWRNWHHRLAHTLT